MPKTETKKDSPTTLLLNGTMRSYCCKLIRWSPSHRARAGIIRALIDLGHRLLQFELAVPGRQLYVLAMDPVEGSEGPYQETERRPISLKL
jgi:hypothetical protein